jgi:hypothetical protein
VVSDQDRSRRNFVPGPPTGVLRSSSLKALTSARLSCRACSSHASSGSSITSRGFAPPALEQDLGGAQALIQRRALRSPAGHRDELAPKDREEERHELLPVAREMAHAGAEGEEGAAAPVGIAGLAGPPRWPQAPGPRGVPHGEDRLIGGRRHETCSGPECGTLRPRAARAGQSVADGLGPVGKLYGIRPLGIRPLGA